jgi:hypothetical protein
MAKAHLASFLHGLGGALGDYVYRRHRGGTVLQRRPVFKQPWSAAQQTTRATFGAGSAFAAKIKADPVLRALYAEHGRRRQLNYRQMAIRDYFTPPTIADLRPDGFTPATGGRLCVEAHDDFEVVRVRYVLRAADATLVAEGEAQRTQGWEIVVPPPPAGAPPAANATITAYDRPGNATERTFPLL